LAQWSAPLVELVASFSFITHFDAFQKGVLDTRDILYFLSVTVFALFTTSVILRSLRAG
jgi:ABC-2 type transport system permease protein